MKSATTILGRGQRVNSTMKRRLTSLAHGLFVAATCAGIACQGEDFGEEYGPEEDLELGVNFEELGTNIATCTAADPTDAVNGFSASSKTLNLTVATNTDAVISVVSGKLKVNGWQCMTNTNVELTSTNVNKLNITAAGTSKVVLDLLPGTYGSIFGNTGGITITGSTGLSVGVRGTAAANNFKMAQEGNGATGPFYMELSGDSRADVKIVGDPGSVSFALGDGADTFTAQGQVLTTTALGGSGATTDVALEAITVFGGAGADTLKGGLGNDTLNGGDGNDVFTTSATNVDDGNDTYIGGANTDTVDYSGRTAALNVSIAPTYDNGWVEGVNIFNHTVPANATFDYSVGGVAGTQIVFPGTPTVGISAILTVLNGGSGLVGATAGFNDRGEIFIKKTGAAGAIAVTNAGTTGLFTGTPSNNGVSQLALDADDGMTSEGDDVRSDVENITGGTGADVLSGSSVSNTINGGGGADSISGGPAHASDCTLDADVLNGGDGNDTFVLGTLTNCGDSLDGGAGTDIANYEMRTVELTLDVDGTADDGEASELDNVKTTVEAVLGGTGADTMTGGTGNDELHGGAGADLISGGAGADSIFGGTGNDTLLGGAGEDYFSEKDTADSAFTTGIIPGTGADILNGGADFDKADYGRTATTAMTVSLCVATTTTAAGVCTETNDAANNDTADGDDITNVEHFIAGAGDDTIFGSTGDDFIEGGAGADSIMGLAGADTLFGDAGNDALEGGEGEDSLDGALGTNTLVGGNGDDICTVGAAGTADSTCEI